MSDPDRTVHGAAFMARASRRDDPLISVIMNGYNSAAYLREALASLLAQTYTNWELIFWDNCSSDDSEAIVRGIGDPRIHFHCAPRLLNLAQGRNAAMACARGEWLAFLDCDDLWESRKLEHQIARLRADGGTDVGLVYARTRSFSARGDEGETVYRYAGRQLPEGNITSALLREGNFVHIVSALISRSALDICGAIPENYTFAEDYWLFVAIASRHRVLCVQDVCCHYRVHEQSATFRAKLASHCEALGVVESWSRFLDPQSLQQRRKEYHTLIGVERLRLPKQRWRGAVELLRDGSLSFLLAGTARTAWRRFIRRRRPYA